MQTKARSCGKFKLHAAGAFAIMFCLLAPLVSYAQQQTPETVPTVYLNHVFIVLDPETYKEIAESEFMREEFSGFEQRTTEARPKLEAAIRGAAATTTASGPTWSCSSRRMGFPSRRPATVSVSASKSRVVSIR